jgi:hypothetical protein
MKSSERREKALIDVISPFPSYRFWAHKMVTLFIFSEKASAYLLPGPFQLNGIQERKIDTDPDSDPDTEATVNRDRDRDRKNSEEQHDSSKISTSAVSC